jgi:hypothetical protein
MADSGESTGGIFQDSRVIRFCSPVYLGRQPNTARTRRRRARCVGPSRRGLRFNTIRHCHFGAVDCRLKTQANEMQLTATERSAIYFQRHKRSKRRAVLFRQLRTSSANQGPDVKQQTFGNAYIEHGLRSGQLSLRGFTF